MSRTIVGTVTSDKNDKTIVVSVATRKTHALYKKRYTVNIKFMAHDEKNEAKIGDKVVIKETRPISARKRFALEKILEKVEIRFQEADAEADIPKEELKTPKAEPKSKKSDEPKAEEPTAEAEEKP